MSRFARMTWKRWILLAIVAAFAARNLYLDSRAGSSLADGIVERLYAEQQSDRIVEIEGRVSKVLPDDRKGSQHQRFIVRLASGHSLLVAHNIDLAPRIPLREGAEIEIRGEYEWNDKGGVLHWTHDDPDGRHENGWIRYEEKLYR